MIIDENKWMSPMRIIKKDGINTIVYSDHNVIKISINWTTGYTSESLGRDSKIMSTNGYRKYREHLTKIGISKIWKEDGDLQEKYERWDRLVKEIKEKYETRKKKNKGRKVSRQLRRCIREIKKDKHNRDIAETRIAILKEEIINEEKASFASKINRTVEELKKEGGAVDQGAFWKLKNKMEVKKKEQKTAIKDGSGKILEDEDSIKQRYQEFYTDLLQTPVSETLEGKQREIEINETFESILKIANYQDKRTIDIQNIIDAVKQLKRRKAGDRDGGQNEMILEGGTEMNYSILHMFNQILEGQNIPNQWKKMTIKSIHKKGSKLLMENRRGLFLTNILSKLFERVLENVTREEIQMSQYQSGGQRKRGTCDNQIMMNAV